MPRKSVWELKPELEEQLILLHSEGFSNQEISKILSSSFNENIRKQQVDKKASLLGLHVSPRKLKKRTHSHEELNTQIEEKYGYVPASWEDGRVTLRDKIDLLSALDKYLSDTISKREAEILTNLTLFLHNLVPVKKNHSFYKAYVKNFSRLDRYLFQIMLDYSEQLAINQLASIALKMKEDWGPVSEILQDQLGLPNQRDDLMEEAQVICNYVTDQYLKLGTIWEKMLGKQHDLFKSILGSEEDPFRSKWFQASIKLKKMLTLIEYCESETIYLEKTPSHKKFKKIGKKLSEAVESYIFIGEKVGLLRWCIEESSLLINNKAINKKTDGPIRGKKIEKKISILKSINSFWRYSSNFYPEKLISLNYNELKEIRNCMEKLEKKISAKESKLWDDCLNLQNKQNYLFYKRWSELNEIDIKETKRLESQVQIPVNLEDARDLVLIDREIDTDLPPSTWRGPKQISEILRGTSFPIEDIFLDRRKETK